MTTPLHHHGMDCCWECFHGRDSHPTDPGDYACAYEREEFGDASECARVDREASR
jgi:hypothetical protein